MAKPTPKDLLNLLATCEESPSVAAFMATADWYLENGDAEMFAAFEWMARRKRWPKRFEQGAIDWWVWYPVDRCPRSAKKNFGHAHIPSTLNTKNENHLGFGYLYRTSFVRSVRWLADRLAELKSAL